MPAQSTPMPVKIHRTFLLFLALSSTPSWADWAVVGASYKCSRDRFSLSASVESSGGSISAPADMQPLKVGENKISCRIGYATIQATIYLSGPGRNGFCGDPGTINIAKLQVNGKDVVQSGEGVLFYCDSQPTITGIDIKRKSGGTIARVCRGVWNWGGEFEKVQCEETTFASSVKQQTAPSKRP